MATISNNDIARAIYLLSKDKTPAKQSAISKKVVKFLTRRRLLSKKEDILLRLNKIINQGNKVLPVKISSARKLAEKTKTQLAQILIKRYSAKKIVFAENLDKKLLGGLRLEVNDEVIDLSVKNKINKLQEYLTKPA